MDKKKKVLIGMLVALGLAAVALAYLFGSGQLFQGYLRYQYYEPEPTTLERLSTGKTVDSAEDDEPAFGNTTTGDTTMIREVESTSSGTFTRIED